MQSPRSPPFSVHRSIGPPSRPVHGPALPWRRLKPHSCRGYPGQGSINGLSGNPRWMVYFKISWKIYKWTSISYVFICNTWWKTRRALPCAEPYTVLHHSKIRSQRITADSRFSLPSVWMLRSQFLLHACNVALRHNGDDTPAWPSPSQQRPAMSPPMGNGTILKFVQFLPVGKIAIPKWGIIDEPF